jgi:hypothetical protein
MVQKYFHDTIFSEAHHSTPVPDQYKYSRDVPMFTMNTFRHLFIQTEPKNYIPKRLEEGIYISNWPQDYHHNSKIQINRAMNSSQQCTD